MKKIYLQNQGSTDELNTNNSINSHLPFHIRIRQLLENRYIIDICNKGEKRINIDKKYRSLQSVFRRIEKEVKNTFGEEIQISNTIERYCHDYCNVNVLYKKYLACCFYDRETETIRFYPNNDILISFRDKGTDKYIPANQSTKKYMHIIQEQVEHHEIEKDWTCHIGKTDVFLRERFAWLIGEYIKKQDNKVEFKITNTLIK